MKAVEFNVESTTGESELLSTESFESTEATSESSDLGEARKWRENERHFFARAREFLSPGRCFRPIVRLYAERKLVIFFWIHFVSTMIIWSHFAMIKFEEQAGKVPFGAPRYWWKRLLPPLEFGSMHAILFQMALLPITMSRYSIAALSDTFVEKFVPLNRALRMHIHLGYTMILIVCLATAFFFAFFGLLCSDGDKTFCAKFTSEIMITGYAILGSLLVIGGTSYYRHKIPYEIFYAIHHLVFIMYFVTIAHTLDIEQRTGRANRSQTFVWFSSTLAFYFCDRATMYINHWYETKLQATSIVTSENSKTVLLHVRRPTLLHFKPGQYVYIRIPAVSRQEWHPFSIASCPESSELDFYIDVQSNKKSWTHRLSNQIEMRGGTNLTVELLGPYGTSITNGGNYSNVLAIGAGTGIVPILSMYKMHIRDLLRMEPTRFFVDKKSHERRIRNIMKAEEERKGSLCVKSVSCCKLNQDMDSKLQRKELLRTFMQTGVQDASIDFDHDVNLIRQAATEATKSLYGVVFLSGLPVLGCTLFGLVVSWSTIPIELHPNMMLILKVLTVIFQAIFAVVVLLLIDAKGLQAFIDGLVCLIAPFADWYFYRVCNTSGRLQPIDIVTYSMLTLYMTFRMWEKAVSSKHTVWKSGNGSRFSGRHVEKLNLVWTTCKAEQVSGLIPDILSLYDLLVSSWGKVFAQQVVSIKIYVTDKDSKACDKLRRELQSTSLYQMGNIHFHRADFERILEDHTIDLVCSEKSASRSLLAFCGSSHLSRTLHECKISNDMLLAMTGNKRHQMDFVSESYGGSNATKNQTDELNAIYEGMKMDTESNEPLTKRHHLSFGRD